MMTDPATIAAPAEPHSSPPITVIVTTILLIIFFIGFFTIYFCRCFMQNVLYSWHARHNPSEIHMGGPGSSGPPGLNPLQISKYPTFLYSNVKEFRHETYGLECAICLSEFEDDNVLRLLTKCYHVFHQECIDLWLESHKSCPFCRRVLEPIPMSPWRSPVSQHSTSMHDIQENELLEDTFTINIRDENERNNANTNTKEEISNKERNNINVHIESNREEDSTEEDVKRKEKFSRSNSTGHSIAKSGEANEDEDRFTLRLPEHIQAKLVHGHNWTRSCTEFGEIKSRTSTTTTGFGEASTSRDVTDVHNE